MGRKRISNQECLDNAKKYNKRSDWHKFGSYFYRYAKNQGNLFFEQCCSHMMNGRRDYFFTDDELINDAKKYKTRAEWDKKSPAMFGVANRKPKEFFEKCCTHMELQNQPWTKKKIFDIARKYKHSNDWLKGHPTSYVAAYKKFGKPFVKKCKYHMTRKDIRKWSKKEILKESKKHINRSQWRLREEGSYAAARRYGFHFFKKCTQHMNPIGKKWTPNVIKKEAKKYLSRSEWRIKSQVSFIYAFKLGEEFVKECLAHMKPHLRKPYNRNDKLIIQEARKCKSRSEWRGKYLNNYSKALKDEELFKKCVKHMGKPLRNPGWTDEEIMKVAKKYSNYAEWRAKHYGMYLHSMRRRKLAKFTKHMVKKRDSYGEILLGNIFSYLFRKRFKKIHMDFVGEIDRYSILKYKNKTYKIGLEHQGDFHYRYIWFFHRSIEGFKSRQNKDKRKYYYAKKQGIYLLRIRDLNHYYKLDKLKIKKRVEGFLISNKIPFSKRRLNQSLNKFLNPKTL